MFCFCDGCVSVQQQYLNPHYCPRSALYIHTHMPHTQSIHGLQSVFGDGEWRIVLHCGEIPRHVPTHLFVRVVCVFVCACVSVSLAVAVILAGSTFLFLVFFLPPSLPPSLTHSLTHTRSPVTTSTFDCFSDSFVCHAF